VLTPTTSRRPGCSEGGEGQHTEHQQAEHEFQQGWNEAAEEEQREREESPSGESKWEELNK
jgi:hypothetical protein